MWGELESPVFLVISEYHKSLTCDLDMYFRASIWKKHSWPKAACVYARSEHSVLILQSPGDICPKFLSAQGAWVKSVCVRGWLTEVALTLADGLGPSDSSSGVLRTRAGPWPLECMPKVHRRSGVPGWGVSHSLTHTWQLAHCEVCSFAGKPFCVS